MRQSKKNAEDTYNELLAKIGLIRGIQFQLDEQKRKIEAYDGSEYSAEYLKLIMEYNEIIEEADSETRGDNRLSKVLSDVNIIIDEYNTKVKAYNVTPPETNHTESVYGTGENVDIWGNIALENISHIDVKYDAAVSKTKETTTDTEGNEIVKWQDEVSTFTVLGIYADEHTYMEQQQKEMQDDAQYSIQYKTLKDDGWHILDNYTKSEEYNEFGGWHYGDEGAPSVEARDHLSIKFYSRVRDSEGKESGFEIELNERSVYSNGTYFKVSDNEKMRTKLANYRYKVTTGEGEEEKQLTLETINGEDYYDISGVSIFAISVLSCEGYDMGTDYYLRGVDLVLSFQTIMEIYEQQPAKALLKMQNPQMLEVSMEAPPELEDLGPNLNKLRRISMLTGTKLQSPLSGTAQKLSPLVPKADILAPPVSPQKPQKPTTPQNPETPTYEDKDSDIPNEPVIEVPIKSIPPIIDIKEKLDPITDETIVDIDVVVEEVDNSAILGKRNGRYGSVLGSRNSRNGGNGAVLDARKAAMTNDTMPARMVCMMGMSMGFGVCSIRRKKQGALGNEDIGTEMNI